MQTAKRFNLWLKQTSDIVVKRLETAGVSTWDCLPLSVQSVPGSEAKAQISEWYSNCSQRQVSSGAPTSRHGSTKFLCGILTLLLLHTASLPDDSNFHRSKNLKLHRPYLIIRSKTFVITDTNVTEKPAQSVFTGWRIGFLQHWYVSVKTRDVASHKIVTVNTADLRPIFPLNTLRTGLLNCLNARSGV